MAKQEDSATSDFNGEMRRLHRVPEPEVLATLLPDARLDSAAEQQVTSIASGLLADLRAAQSEGWVNRFLQEYRLNTSEGIALLSLAEAFLRVPDAETADRLVADKLGNADWQGHAGQSDSLIVNSATWGLVISRALVGTSPRTGVLRTLLARAGEPFVRTAVGAAMRMIGQIFVMGRTIDEAIERMAGKEHQGFTASFDMLGEAARTMPDADRYFEAYERAINAVGKERERGHSISVKLSALHPRYEVSQWESCVPALIERLSQLCRRAANAGIPFTVDAEESERLEMSLAIIGAVARDAELEGWDGFGMAIQAYGKRASAVIDWVNALGAETGHRMTVRLVKGAYWDSEIKRTQEAGLSDYPLFTRKAATDVSYLACARKMLAAPYIHPAFATHNARTVATILHWAGDSRDFEFQRLHGMGEGLFERLVREEGHHCRIYAPVGGHRDLLAYLVRRLLENGANSSFVHQLADEAVSDAALLADPAAKIERVGGTPHPSIPLPKALFAPERRNSEGYDLNDHKALTRLAKDIAVQGISVTEPSLFSLDDMIEQAERQFPTWAATPVEERAACLDRLADLLERNRTELMAICVKEGKKTLPDALAEVREAVDFCRYYAARARADFSVRELPGPTGERNSYRLEGRGPFACIAPWNFPLAIFLGQVTAALVAGNTVIAKPAPQTPLIAARAVALAHEAGIPKQALQLAIGGPEIGATLVADPRIKGVAFTGSTATAKKIARSLLDDETRPLVPLIAETGGLNAMIVDSTALPEQVVNDIITSAFRSAGQRCSALRLLILQEDIADAILEMLRGAMDMLRIGDPADPATDVGPVIDEAAHHRLMSYRRSMRDRWLHSLPVPEEGYFVPPTIIRLDEIEELRQEWFGPLLHVTTWKAGELESTIERINAAGYGLTMGLHSRIAATADLVTQRARVGNLYVNRSMIGAIVGSQPFGGEGLSGTGPKAGGPLYLPRFAVERVVSTDTTSAGGNATLLSIEDIGI